MRIVSGSTTEYLHFVAFSTADHVTRVTDLTSFGTFATVGGSTGSTGYNITVSAVNSTQGPGIYKALIHDSTLTTLPAGIDSREVSIHFTSSMDPVTRTFELYRRCVTTGQTLALNSSGKIADVESILSKVTSIETNTTGLVTKLSSVEANTTALVTKLTSVESDVDSVLSKVTSIETNTTGLVTKLTSVESDVDGLVTKLTSVETDVDAILADTGTDGVVVASIANNAITAAALAADAGAEIADAVLNRDMGTGTDSGSASVRTPRQALRFLRNKWEIAGGTLTVYKEDDATESWTGAVATTASDPVNSVDPTGP